MIKIYKGQLWYVKNSQYGSWGAISINDVIDDDVICDISTDPMTRNAILSKGYILENYELHEKNSI